MFESYPLCGYCEKIEDCYRSGKSADDCPVEAMKKAVQDIVEVLKGFPLIAAVLKLLGKEDDHET
jgi:hypothetical protein